ncbi:hypothetical protein DMB44_01325 [Thermoplasma sp. Kam2015]|uniref:hypothetical protein n=1 Tax=Thermoplasma sp. Kam2015 TaxID=2094122 RepID=UPI000D9E81EB|nr:hypothetical protein [Thermoplasma sp. Kam2015]PYB68920.1 hypothetical protein DMB44_01325 [Thermoplasma sp. Kam2015]
MLFSYGLLIASFFVFVITAIYSSLSDMRKRSVNSFTFLPMFAVAALYYALIHDYYLTAFTLTIAAATFIRTDSYIYLILPVAAFIMAMILGCLSIGSTIAVVLTLLGYRETLFGIGDVKAEVSYILAFQYISRPLFGASVFAISFLIYLSIFSVLAIAAFYVHATIIGLKFRGIHLAYDEAEYSRNRQKYRVIGSGDQAIMSYRMPFLVPINLAALFAVLIGLPQMFI